MDQHVIFLSHTTLSADLDGVKVDLYDGREETLSQLTAKGWRVLQITASTDSKGVYALIEKSRS